MAQKKQAEFLASGDADNKINLIYMNSFTCGLNHLDRNISLITENIKNKFEEATGLKQQFVISEEYVGHIKTHNFHGVVSDPLNKKRYENNSATIILFLSHSSSLNRPLQEKDRRIVEGIAGHEVAHTFYKYLKPKNKSWNENHNEEHLGDNVAGVVFGPEGLKAFFGGNRDTDDKWYPASKKRCEYLEQNGKNPYFSPATLICETIKRLASEQKIISLVNSLEDYRPEDFIRSV